MSTVNFRVNETIRVPEVRLIGPTGENLGVVSIERALQIAREAELDLVEVSAGAVPPVCRVMDFGKFIYERTKKEREARKAQTKIEVKEIRLRPKTNEHHRGFKTRDARRWLEDGMKVRVSVRFRGREITYPELALEDLREIAEELADIATVEQAPSLEGKLMSMTLTPSRPGHKKAAAPKAEAAEKPKSAKPAAQKDQPAQEAAPEAPADEPPAED
ncbi:MAG TPA: translation initiation factor IF-3 [Anaerolineaceae bacterium]|nr:translation initiation factor IF-3 [Anaerolineaceae bacterium]HPA34594.1 translation initiation factor IF-3 [Anaerolineaceae bacterium]HQH36765.1 translation initiation factor IF-3 [Anaerolineaceae bacterium]